MKAVLCIVLATLFLGFLSVYYERRGTILPNELKSEYLDEFYKLKKSKEKCVFNNVERPFIAHAGGGIVVDDKALTYTNSKEALEQSLQNGYTFIELDLIQNSDGHFFAAHDPKHFYGIIGSELTIENAPQVPSEVLENARIHGKLTILKAPQIVEFFQKYPNVFLVTDKSNNLEALAEQFAPIKDRLIIEIFDVNTYYKARKMGFLYPVLSASIFALATEWNIPMLAFSTRVLENENTRKEAQKYIENGGCGLAFSTNDSGFIIEHLRRTTSLFYVDFWDVKKNICSVAQTHPESCAHY